MRGVMQAMAKGRPVKLSQLSTPEENKVFAFMRDLGRDELSKMTSIIQIRNKYEGAING
jgi:predicted transcriptional regulator